MTSTTSVTQQALLAQLLQQEQLQQAATAKAAATAQTTAAQGSTAQANTAQTALPTSLTAALASVDTSQTPQIGAAFSAALSKLGSSDSDKTTHDGGHHGSNRKVDQAIQSYGEQGPSQETTDASLTSQTAAE